MTQHNPSTESQKLIRCTVVNGQGEASVRLVELDNFRLWEHLMVSKHQLQVRDPYLCLWLHDAEYRENAELYQGASEVEPVNRIVIDIYDPELGFANTTTRFVPAEETERVLGILRSHMPEGLAQSPNTSIEVFEGHIVQQWQHSSNRPAPLGLQG
jgi:hypothetical protein